MGKTIDDRASINQQRIEKLSLDELFQSCSEVKSYFEEHGIEPLSESMSLQAVTDSLTDHWLRDHGMERGQIIADIGKICNTKPSAPEFCGDEIRQIKVRSGYDKMGMAERFSVSFQKGETVCICGRTGSGKTRLLEDVEYIACGDSPTGRVVEVNGAVPTEEQRFFLESRLCARLSQSMNFVLELSCHDFITMHARCRNRSLSDEDICNLEKEIMDCANSLAGEKFHPDMMITELSGGQSRALMIADLAHISNAQVILIDEPENAGIDRDDILDLLSSKGKIVLVSTHDPLIALSCKKRIVIKNGGIEAIIERTEAEEQLLAVLKKRDNELKEIRNLLREGKYADEKYV